MNEILLNYIVGYNRIKTHKKEVTIRPIVDSIPVVIICQRFLITHSLNITFDIKNSKLMEDLLN